MFSLIITIISIALVAALALATLYYGGGAFNKGASLPEPLIRPRSRTNKTPGAFPLNAIAFAMAFSWPRKSATRWGRAN